MDVASRLSDAIGTGEIIRIIYHGGTRPGSHREIAPISLDGSQVRARCYATNAVKTFALAKIELVAAPPSQSISAPHYAEAPPAEPEWQTLEQVFDACRGEFETAGWHVSLREGEDGRKALELRRRTKGGQPRIHPVAMLYYAPVSYDWVLMPNGDSERRVKPRSRPWGVSVQKHDTGTWGQLSRAVSEFLKAARSLSP